MEKLFDIEFVTSHFSSCAPGKYLSKLKSASNSELQAFKFQVISHKRKNKEQQAFMDIPNYSTHKAVISAIEYELLKRSWKYNLYTIIFPIRKWLVNVFSDIELKEHEYFGALYSYQKSHPRVWHLSHNELIRIVIHLVKSYSYKTLMVVGTVGVFIILLIKQINSQ